MKKEEKNNEKANKNIIVIALVTVIILLLIVLIGLIIMNQGKKLENCNCKSLEKTITCKKVNETNEDAYILHVDSTGEIEGYDQKVITPYTEEEYNAIKKDYQASENETIEFKDNEHQLIQIFEKGIPTDADGNQLHIWYKDFTSSLTADGYQCD